ncbi:MAG: hypothetical protein QXS20_06590 [Candidatus Thorarchaeota archaeon]
MTTERERQRRRGPERNTHESDHQGNMTETTAESETRSDTGSSPLVDRTETGQMVPGITENRTIESAQALLLPRWGTADDAGHMYSIPSDEKSIASWASEWADFVNDWMRSRGIHILSRSTFMSEIPFREFSRRIEAYSLIGDHMVRTGAAKWLDRDHTRLRVYWKSLEDWVDEIYKWALDTGNMLLDVKSIVIQERDQVFSSLPEDELHLIMERLVDRKQATWVDQRLGAVKLRVTDYSGST